MLKTQNWILPTCDSFPLIMSHICRCVSSSFHLVFFFENFLVLKFQLFLLFSAYFWHFTLISRCFSSIFACDLSRLCIWMVQDVKYDQAPDSETSLTPVFLSSTCFWPSGAAQQQLGFLNFTSGSIWKWRLQWRNSGSPIERSVAYGTLIDAPRYTSAWKQHKRR